MGRAESEEGPFLSLASERVFTNMAVFHSTQREQTWRRKALLHKHCRDLVKRSARVEPLRKCGLPLAVYKLSGWIQVDREGTPTLGCSWPTPVSDTQKLLCDSVITALVYSQVPGNGSLY